MEYIELMYYLSTGQRQHSSEKFKKIAKNADNVTLGDPVAYHMAEVDGAPVGYLVFES